MKLSKIVLLALLSYAVFSIHLQGHNQDTASTSKPAAPATGGEIVLKPKDYNE